MILVAYLGHAGFYPVWQLYFAPKWLLEEALSFRLEESARKKRGAPLSKIETMPFLAAVFTEKRLRPTPGTIRIPSHARCSSS